MLAQLRPDDGEHGVDHAMNSTFVPALHPHFNKQPLEDQTMNDLKARIATHEYRVDSGLVAEEILEKLRLLKRARRQLSEGGRSRRTPGPAR